MQDTLGAEAFTPFHARRTNLCVHEKTVNGNQKDKSQCLPEWYKCQGSSFLDKRPHVAVLLIGDLQMEVLDFAHKGLTKIKVASFHYCQWEDCPRCLHDGKLKIGENCLRHQVQT